LADCSLLLLLLLFCISIGTLHCPLNILLLVDLTSLNSVSGKMEGHIRATRQAVEATNNTNYSRDVLRIRSLQIRSEKWMVFENEQERSEFLNIVKKEKSEAPNFQCALNSMRDFLFIYSLILFIYVFIYLFNCFFYYFFIIYF
jgi:hypothetical protein